jgi:hypothetical protein
MEGMMLLKRERKKYGMSCGIQLVKDKISLIYTVMNYKRRDAYISWFHCY